MKIITEKAAYVQKNDLIYLHHTDLSIPASIYLNFFRNGIVIVDDSNRYDFEKFEDPREIEFFRSLDWMVDYFSVKDLSEDEIIRIGQSIAEEKNQIASEYNLMPEEERKKNIGMVAQYKALDFKMHSLSDIILFKRGCLEMPLPEGIDYPEGYSPKRESRIQKFMKRFISKKDKKEK